MEVLEELRGAYARRTEQAVRAHAAGQRVIGYFWDSLPVELIEAAGAFPLRVTGYPAPASQVLDEKLYALLPKGFWQVRQSSLDFLNNSFGRLVDGTYAMLDALVVPNVRKPLLNIATQLRVAGQYFPDLKLPRQFLLDRANAPTESAHAYNRAAVHEVRADLEAWLGESIADEAIRAAVKRRRDNAALLRTIIGWRRADRPGISGSDMLAVIGAGGFMSASEYGALLAKLVAAGPAEQRTGPRVFIGGSPPDNDQLYRLIERLGATVVGEDHCWGERCVDFHDDADNADPMALLARRWDHPNATGFRLPVGAVTADIVARAKACRADVAILNVFAGDEMQIWDTPAQAEALAAAGIPALRLMEQPHILADTAALERTIGEFLATARVPA